MLTLTPIDFAFFTLTPHATGSTSLTSGASHAGRLRMLTLTRLDFACFTLTPRATGSATLTSSLPQTFVVEQARCWPVWPGPKTELLLMGHGPQGLRVHRGGSWGCGVPVQDGRVLCEINRDLYATI